MPPKRGSFLDQLKKELPVAPEPVRGEAKPSNSNAPEARAGISKTSLYIPDAVKDRLREIAFTERCKMHDLFLEGLDRVIESRGHPERALPKKA